ncbi:hypothetical protein DM2_1582 [Halorubrum sp. DM2]|uniref:DUF2249 domain-containing protein n=1 Tax=Halorubrum sp. DM2 TaxID=2527867 RepID=UPI0024B6BC44|nr:DUF2249 domain-containing protein [Halorubrum sp. DM2]VTT88248.1 hypothetical protein DM2_1582 [Halorubrum sp. DM2]
MTTDIDLRDRPDDEYRDRIRDALDGVEPGEELLIAADRDVDVHLIRYQIDRGRDVEWEHDGGDAGPREVRAVDRGELDGPASGTADVRDLPPRRRHAALVEAFDRLEPDEGFVLVNDHDPKPLYYELRSTYGDVVGWEYASRGAGEWRVAIEKTDEATAAESEAFTRFDVREIPKADRHETIHHRYRMIPDGETMELIAPHEPRPLHGEFRERYGDAFRWEVVEQEPGRCRVRITKTEGSASAEATSEAADSEIDDAETASENEATTASDGSPAVTRELDVRDLPPAQRHEEIFDAYAALDDGDGFVLVNDHDPKPLYHQFEAEAGPEFHWEYRRQEPGEFRVLIGKRAADAENHDHGATEGTSAPF